MKKASYTPLIIVTAVTIFLILIFFFTLPLPALPMKKYNEHTFLLRYKIVGCGSLVRTVERGGEELYKDAGLDSEPEVYEVKFTDDSFEPADRIDSAAFFTGGIAEKYTYVVYGEVVGTARGAPDCCYPNPVYNETVPLFKIIRWAPSTFIFADLLGIHHFFIILVLVFLIPINCIVWITYVKRRIKRNI